MTGKLLAFGKYLLIEQLKTGGMAEIWRALDPDRPGRFVVVKRLLSQMADDPEMVSMFINEARVAVQLVHPGIAQIFDLGLVGEDYYIALEHIAGADLLAIRSTPLPLGLAAYVGTRLCSALDYAHRKTDAAGRPLGIVHRDVTPDNCLVTFDGEVKLIDFGVAKLVASSVKTRVGTLKGKFSYMSPEQIHGMPVDRRSDIFSLAVVLYELLTGQRLFDNPGNIATLQAVCYAPIERPTHVNMEIPPELERIVLKGLKRERESRYAWASEMGADLHDFLAQQVPMPGAEELREFMHERFRSQIELEEKRGWQHLRARSPLLSMRTIVDRLPTVPAVPDFGECEEDQHGVGGRLRGETVQVVPDPVVIPLTFADIDPEVASAPGGQGLIDTTEPPASWSHEIACIEALLNAELAELARDEGLRPTAAWTSQSEIDTGQRGCLQAPAVQLPAAIARTGNRSPWVNPLMPLPDAAAAPPLSGEDIRSRSLAALGLGSQSEATRADRKRPFAKARRWQRHPANVDVKGRWVGPGDQPIRFAARIVDLSQGGARLRTREQVPVMVPVQLTIPIGLLKKLDLSGVAQWERRVGDDQELGVEFTQPHPELLTKVLRLQGQRPQGDSMMP